MKKYIFSALVAAAAIFAGCSKNELPSAMESPRVVKVSVGIETRVATSADNTKYQWEAGDVIGVWTGAAFTPFTVDAASVGQCAGTFTGTLPEGGSVTESSIAVYPFCAEDTYADGIYTSNYNGDNWNYKTGAPMLAKATASLNGSTVANFKFGLLTAAAKLTIRNIPADANYIFLEAPQRILSGTGSADVSAEFPKIDSTIKSGDESTFGSFDYAFVALPEHSGVIEEFTAIIPIVTGQYADPKFRFTLFSAEDWGAEFPKDPYNHVGYLNTGGYINRGDLYILPVVTF